MVDDEKEQNLREYYVLKLISVPADKKISLLKGIRNITNCDLQTGKDIIDTPDSIITYADNETIANEWKQLLEQIGATIELENIQSEKSLSELNEIPEIQNEQPTEHKEDSNLNLKSNFDIKNLLSNGIFLLLVMSGIALYLHGVSKPHVIDYILLFGLFIFRYFTCLEPGKSGNIVKFLFNTFLFVLGITLMVLDYPSAIQIGMYMYFVFFAPLLDGYLYLNRSKILTGCFIMPIILFILFITTLVCMSDPGYFTPEATEKREAIEKQEALKKEQEIREVGIKTVAGIVFRPLSIQYTSEAGLQLYGIVSTGNSLVLQVNVEIKNEGNSPYKLSKLGATLIDNNGAKYDGAVLTNVANMLDASNNILNPGTSTTKILFFKVPEKKDYTIKLYDGNFFSDPVEIKL